MKKALWVGFFLIPLASLSYADEAKAPATQTAFAQTPSVQTQEAPKPAVQPKAAQTLELRAPTTQPKAIQVAAPQSPAPTAPSPAAPKVALRLLTGKVQSVSVGANANIMVVDSTGAVNIIKILEKTTIVDKTDAAIPLYEIKSRSDVTLKYLTMKNGTKAATAIKVAQ